MGHTTTLTTARLSRARLRTLAVLATRDVDGIAHGADAARDTAHQARAAKVHIAAEAWTAVATHAATQAIDCRRGAELADRTRHRWAR